MKETGSFPKLLYQTLGSGKSAQLFYVLKVEGIYMAKLLFNN